MNTRKPFLASYNAPHRFHSVDGAGFALDAHFQAISNECTAFIECLFQQNLNQQEFMVEFILIISWEKYQIINLCKMVMEWKMHNRRAYIHRNVRENPILQKTWINLLVLPSTKETAYRRILNNQLTNIRTKLGTKFNLIFLVQFNYSQVFVWIQNWLHFKWFRKSQIHFSKLQHGMLFAVQF